MWYVVCTVMVFAVMVCATCGNQCSPWLLVLSSLLSAVLALYAAARRFLLSTFRHSSSIWRAIVSHVSVTSQSLFHGFHVLSCCVKKSCLVRTISITQQEAKQLKLLRSYSTYMKTKSSLNNYLFYPLFS